MDYTALINYYLGAIASISLVMEILVKVDKLIPTWSLSEKFKILGIEVTWNRIIGLLLSIGVSVFMTLSGGYPLLYFIGGALAIYATQFGVGKLGWRAIFEVIINMANAFKKK